MVDNYVSDFVKFSVFLKTVLFRINGCEISTVAGRGGDGWQILNPINQQYSGKH
jgi:hypothetical protein